MQNRFGDELDASTDAPILDPWEQKAHAPKPKKLRLGIAAIVAVCVGQIAVVGAGAWGVMHYVSTSRRALAVAKQETPTARDEVESKNPSDPGDTVHAPVAPALPQVGPKGSVPQETERRTIGDVKVVEIGVKVPSLRQALSSELAAAKASGKDVLVMTTRAGCDPCVGVERAMSDSSMQRALSPVVVVKIDVDVFDKELDAMQLQHDAIPGFFLLAPDSSPRDAIHGGEWDADIAENIAPVLGPFVRGEYTKRKNDWKKPLPHGVFL